MTVSPEEPRQAGQVVASRHERTLRIQILGVLGVSMGTSLRQVYLEAERGTDLDTIEVDFKFTRTVLPGSAGIFLNLLEHARRQSARVRLLHLREEDRWLHREVQKWALVNWGPDHPLD